MGVIAGPEAPSSGASLVLIIPFFILGVVFVWSHPLVSTIIFLIGVIFAMSLIAISRGVLTGVIVGIPSVLLTFLSMLGYFELRKKRQK